MRRCMANHTAGAMTGVAADEHHGAKEQAMARIRPLEPTEVGPETRAIFERLFAQRGNMPNMFRTMALRPEIMATAEAHLHAIFTTGSVEPRLKEMLAVRVSQINDCYY